MVKKMNASPQDREWGKDVLEILASGIRWQKKTQNDWKKKIKLPVLADHKEFAKQLLELITGDFSRGSSG